MKSLVVILLCLGIIMIVTGYNKSMINNNKNTKIEYRYVPRTFFEEQNAPQNLQKSFNSLFNDRSTWDTYPIN